MVVDQIKELDKNIDNQIDENELREAIKLNWFLYREENLQALWNLLNNCGIDWVDQELLSSLEQSFYNLKENILKKDRITEEDKKLLKVYKNILWWKCDDELKEINDFIKHQEEIERQEQEIQMQEQENTRIYNEILQEVETEISATQDNYIENLISLWIKPNTQLNRNKLRENIKTLDDIEKIDETNIKEYIKIPNDVPSTNYEYIANNIKSILNVHLQLHPKWESIVWKGWLATNMDIGTLLDNNRYLSKIIKEINEIQDIDQQISFCINKFPDWNYLDLCIKRILSSKKYKQEDVFKKIFEKIPIQKSEKFFRSCDKNSFINELKSNYTLYWLNKNNSIKTWENYCFLDLANKSKFDNFYWEKIKLSDDLSFDQLYKYTNEFYKQLNNIWLADSSIPIWEIMSFIKFKELKDNENKKLQKERDKEISNNNSTPIVWNPESIAIWHVNLNKSTHSAYSEKMWKNCLAIDTEYVKLLLKGKNKPTWKVQPISWADYVLDFSKWKDPQSIIRDSWKEKIWDQRDKFKYDLKNDRQAAFWSLTWMVWWIAWSAAAAIFTKNIWATSAGFTAWLRLWNGIWQEIWNSWEYLYEQISWNTISDWNNKVEKFWQWFLRWVWVLDQNYEYVWTAKFLSWLWFDYLSTVATFGLSQKFWWFLWKLEWVKFAWWALKFWMEELILENFFVDIPMNIVQSWFETFTGIDDWITIWNTAIWNQHTQEWQWYKSWSLSDAIRAMKDATKENLSFENLSQTFFNTIIYWWFLEWWWAAIKKMKWYLPAWQVSNFTERSAIAATAFAWLTKFMSSKNINFNKDWKCIDTSTNLEITESDPRFGELCEHINAVNVTKTWVIESFETIMETQRQMITDPENKTGLLFRLWLISPTNTPLNILRKKKELVEKKLSKAKSKWDNAKVNQLQKLLDIYTDAESKLTNINYFNWQPHKFDVTEIQAKENSVYMDDIINNMNEINKSEKLAELRTRIKEQSKLSTWQEMELTDEQLLSAIEAHKKIWILWNVKKSELLVKNRILVETIKDEDVRRFLFEAWFCWMDFDISFDLLDWYNLYDSPDSILTDQLNNMDMDYQINYAIEDENDIEWIYDENDNSSNTDTDKTNQRDRVKEIADTVKDAVDLLKDNLPKDGEENPEISIDENSEINIAETISYSYIKWQRVNIPRSNWNISIAIITDYNPKTWRYTVARTENGKNCKKYITKEQLDRVNDLRNTYNDIEFDDEGNPIPILDVELDDEGNLIIPKSEEDWGASEYDVNDIVDENGNPITSESLRNVEIRITRPELLWEKRQETQLRNIEESEFQLIQDETMIEIWNDLRDTFWSTNYDSFDLYLRLIRNRKPWETLRDSFRTLSLSDIDTSRWTICTWMARILQAKLSQKWINSHMIRFKAWWTKNNEYLWDWHTALIIPRVMEGWSSWYTLLDPWLLISQPITFWKWENPPIDINWVRYQIKYTWDGEYPYSMFQYKRNKETNEFELKKEMPFNPEQERLNPEQTLNTEILRVFTDFKIAKQDNEWNNMALIRLTLWDANKPHTIDIRWLWWEKQPELTIDEFKNIKNSPRYQDFLKACEILWRDPNVMYDELMLWINNIDEYVSTIQNTSSIK